MPLTYCSENKGEYARDTELSFSRCFCSVSGVKEKKKPNSVAHIKIIFLHFISSTSFFSRGIFKVENRTEYVSYLLQSLLALLTRNWTIAWHITREAGTLTEHLQG